MQTTRSFLCLFSTAVVFLSPALADDKSKAEKEELARQEGFRANFEEIVNDLIKTYPNTIVVPEGPYVVGMVE